MPEKKKKALGRIRVRCRYLRHKGHKVNKSKYKTNTFYDWLFQIVYICHCLTGQTLIPMPCFPNDILNQTQHTFMMDRDFIKAKRLVSAALYHYHSYCITNVPRRLQFPLESWIIETRTKLLCSEFRSIYTYLHNEFWLQIFVVFSVYSCSNFPNSYITYQTLNVRGGAAGVVLLSGRLLIVSVASSQSRLYPTAIGPRLSKRFFAEKICLPHWNK